VNWRSVLAERIVDPTAAVLRRVPVPLRLAEFRAAQWGDPAIFRARQTGRLADLLVHATTRVPFYAERMLGATPEAIRSDPWGCLQAFPVLERNNLEHHLEELTCDVGQGVLPYSSGGSTGVPVRFYRDRRYLAAAIASTQLCYEWAGLRRGERHIRLWGATRDFRDRQARLKGIGRWLCDVTFLDAFRMGEEDMRRYVRFLNRRPVACLEGYAESLFALAEFAEHEGLRVTPPGGIMSSAGMLHPHMRETVERVFAAPVFDRYGCREVSSIAAECERHRGLHILGETTIVELVDRDAREVSEGETGEILVTNLWNYTTPFIRYRVGDEAVRGADCCDCGRPYPLLERIVGRTGAGVVRDDGTTVPPVFFAQLLGVEENHGNIASFQIVQETTDWVRVRLVSRRGTGGPDGPARDSIAARIREVMESACRVDFEVVEEIEPTPTGKHLSVVSRVAGRTSRTSTYRRR